LKVCCGRILAMNSSDCRIFAANSHPALAQEISKTLKMPLGKVDLRRFSCGEIFVNFEDSVRGKHVFLIGTTGRGSVNEDFMEIFLMADAARRSFAKKVHVVLPHFGYARQDKIHNARESISAKLMANLLVKAGCDHLITLHLHSDQIQAFFDVPVDNLHAKKILVQKVKDERIQDPIVVSPDAGGAKFAKKFADLLGVDLAILHKTRPAHNKAEISQLIGNVAGKSCILVDDMVDTAGSVCAARETLVRSGSNEQVFLVATHPIFSGQAIERLSAANFAKIFVTNSMPLPQDCTKDLPIEQISIAPLVSSVIESIMSKKSVSKLFF